MSLSLNTINYKKHGWEVCADIKVIGLLLGLWTGMYEALLLSVLSQLSTRYHAASISILSVRILRHVLQKRVNLYPYKTQVAQELKERI
jgi:hypothetical protein